MVGIFNILFQRYNLKPDQRVLVIYDDRKEAIARGFIKTAKKIGANVEHIKLGKERFGGGKIDEIISIIKRKKFRLYLNIIDSRIEETAYRIKLTQAQIWAGGIVGHAPGITKKMVAVRVDYDRVVDRAKKLKELFRGATYVRIKTRLGTAIKVKIEGRKFLDDVQIGSQISNIPCGELWCAPHEDGADGVIIADGSAGSFGLLPQPLVMKVKKGRIVTIRWLFEPERNEVLLKKIRKALFIDEGANVIGELGIGLAPFEVSGNMLQDEKADGTIHIAFGNNCFFGGKNKSASHIDFLVRKPDLRIYYSSRGKDTKSIKAIVNGESVYYYF